MLRKSGAVVVSSGVPASDHVDVFRDHTLALIAHLVNVVTLNAVPVTVLVGGQWISGDAIAGRAWFDEIAHLVRETLHPLADALGAAGASLYPSRAEPDGLVPPAALHNHAYFLQPTRRTARRP